MKYRKDKYGNELSQLGYGCMRFTGKGGRIDYEKAGGRLTARAVIEISADAAVTGEALARDIQNE